MLLNPHAINATARRVLARRIHRGANKKGFGNARACDRELDIIVQKQQARLVKQKMRKVRQPTRHPPSPLAARP